MSDKSSIESEQYVVTAAQSTLNGSLFHRGDREDGAECGQHAPSGWAQFEAANPAIAVLDYAYRPCTDCFGDHRRGLRGIYTARHGTSTLYRGRESDFAEWLPWEVEL